MHTYCMLQPCEEMQYYAAISNKRRFLKTSNYLCTLLWNMSCVFIEVLVKEGLSVG